MGSLLDVHEGRVRKYLFLKSAHFHIVATSHIERVKQDKSSGEIT